jgi:folate-dependent phosphoribosylglycinamide formyltransferase PurN
MLCGRGRSSNIVFNALDRAIGVETAIVETRVPMRQLLRSRIRRFGSRTVFGQVLFRSLVVPALAARSKERIEEILRQHGLDEAPIPDGKRVDVSSVNSDEVKRLLRELDPDVVVINGTRIIRGDVLETIDATFINMHAGITPAYRGIHGGYWALVEGDREACGVTVHVVDAGIDTGHVVGQALISPSTADNIVTYPFLQLAAGLPLMEEAVRDASKGTLKTRAPIRQQSRLWSHPTLGEYVGNRLIHGVK